MDVKWKNHAGGEKYLKTEGTRQLWQQRKWQVGDDVLLNAASKLGLRNASTTGDPLESHLFAVVVILSNYAPFYV